MYFYQLHVHNGISLFIFFYIFLFILLKYVILSCIKCYHSYCVFLLKCVIFLCIKPNHSSAFLHCMMHVKKYICIPPIHYTCCVNFYSSKMSFIIHWECCADSYLYKIIYFLNLFELARRQC